MKGFDLKLCSTEPSAQGMFQQSASVNIVFKYLSNGWGALVSYAFAKLLKHLSNEQSCGF